MFSAIMVTAQVNDDSIRQIVLRYNIIDTTYVFGEWNEKGGTETHLRFLGTINSDSGKYKIMTSSWYFALSKRASSKILIYNDKNEYIGFYYVGMTYELPDAIDNNELIFRHSDNDDCDNNLTTRLSFKHGIPEEFFLECKNGFGDIYPFSKD